MEPTGFHHDRITRRMGMLNDLMYWELPEDPGDRLPILRQLENITIFEGSTQERFRDIRIATITVLHLGPVRIQGGGIHLFVLYFIEGPRPDGVGWLNVMRDQSDPGSFHLIDLVAHDIPYLALHMDDDTYMRVRSGKRRIEALQEA